MSRPLALFLAVLGLIGLLQAGNAWAVDRLLKQEIYPVGLWVGPALPELRDESQRRAAEAHVFRLAASGAQALMCEYEIAEGGGRSFAHVNLWYGTVGATQRELVAVSKGHPLALLGDQAFRACPSSPTEAARYAQDSLQRFRKMAAGMDPDDPGPLPPFVPPAGELVGCAVIQDYPVEGRFLLVNRCNFAVNIKYCGSSPGVRNPKPCTPGIPQHIGSHQRMLLVLPLSERARWMACRHPDVPVATWVRDRKAFHWACIQPTDDR